MLTLGSNTNCKWEEVDKTTCRKKKILHVVVTTYSCSLVSTQDWFQYLPWIPKSMDAHVPYKNAMIFAYNFTHILLCTLNHL